MHTPTYHEPTNGYLPSNVYVPTSRVLPMQYMPGQPTTQASQWDAAMTSRDAPAHAMTSRFAFPPTPSPPITSPGMGHDGGFVPRTGGAGMPPYTYMPQADLSPWNSFNGFNQQGLRQPMSGE